MSSSSSSPDPNAQGTEPLPLPSSIGADWATLPNRGEVITSLATGNTYTIGEKIGEGNFGIVYACVDRWNNDLAAKVMKPLGTYESVKQSTESELEKLRLLRHPYVTYIFDAFEYRDTFYLITERCHCPLTNLFRLNDFHGLFWIKPIARCILQAVHFVHTSGYAHQDIHLGNVFASFAKDEMTPEELGAVQFKLGDLGVAKLFSEVNASNTRAVWMLPPEVSGEPEFGPIDHRQDIYHCGLLFLHLAHGKELQFTPEEIIAGLPRELALQLPQPFNFALEKALRRHVAFRTESAMELWRDLNSPGIAKAEPPVTTQLELGNEE